MSTSSSRARRLADATKGPGAGGDAAAAQAWKARLEAAEAAAAQAAQAAADASAVAQAAVEAAAALPAEIKVEEAEEEGEEEDEAESGDSGGSRQTKNHRGRSSAAHIYREIGSVWPMLT